MKFLLGLIALLPSLANASYFDLTRNTEEAQQCVSFDVRYPYWTRGVYIATYPGHSRSKEGWIAPYYGGVVSDKTADSQLIQFASWQMGGKGAPTSGIDFVHADRWSHTCSTGKAVRYISTGGPTPNSNPACGTGSSTACGRP